MSLRLITSLLVYLEMLPDVEMTLPNKPTVTTGKEFSFHNGV